MKFCIFTPTPQREKLGGFLVADFLSNFFSQKKWLNICHSQTFRKFHHIFHGKERNLSFFERFFPSFPGILGFGREKILVFWWFSLPFSKKKQGKEGHGSICNSLVRPQYEPPKRPNGRHSKNPLLGNHFETPTPTYKAKT